MSEAEYSGLIASSASSDQMVIEISTALIELSYFFCIFSRFSFLHWHRISLIYIHCFFCCVTSINSCSGRNIPRNFASHFNSVPFSSELYKAYFGALSSNLTGLRLPNYAKRILSIQGKKIGYSEF